MAAYKLKNDDPGVRCLSLAAGRFCESRHLRLRGLRAGSSAAVLAQWGSCGWRLGRLAGARCRSPACDEICHLCEVWCTMRAVP